MSLINLILDVAGLLLWLSWRSIRFDPLVRATPATLAGTIRRAEPSRLRRWHFLAILAGLLVVRAMFYTQIGPAVDWTPRLDLGAVALAFRGNAFVTELLFSVLSFIRAFVIFHFWLLALAVANGLVAEPNPYHKMILLQLGRITRWPLLAQALAPGLAVAAFWIGTHPLLAYVGVVRRAESIAHLVEQSLVVGIAVYFTLKILLPAFLFLHLIASYVYLGKSPFLDFIGMTARNILAPLTRRLPMRYGKMDFAPLVGIVLILLVLHVLPGMIQILLDRRQLTIWPQ